jgi:hypothetical protein
MSRLARVADVVENQTSAFDAPTKTALQAVFFVVLTHSHALREVVCCREHRDRLVTHRAHGPPATVRAFFRDLVPLTERYIAYAITGEQYIKCVRLLSRVGCLLEDLRGGGADGAGSNENLRPAQAQTYDGL